MPFQLMAPLPSTSVTWIMPILNGMPYLPEALQSMANQTTPAAELLVWDNGSTDGSLEELRRWIPHRIPGRIFSGRPLSLGNSLAALALEATTPLLARMDADDICHPARLERQLVFWRRHPHLAAIGSERRCMDETGNLIANPSRFPSCTHEIRNLTLRAPRMLHPSVMLSRSALLECGNYRDLGDAQQPYWSEDYDLWLRLQAKHLIGSSTEALLDYRINPRGVSQEASRTRSAALARRSAWMQNAAAFAAISDPGLAAALWDRQLWFALPLLKRLCRHLCSVDQFPEALRLRMPSFRHTASSFVRRGDWLTRFWLKWQSQKPAHHCTTCQ